MKTRILAVAPYEGMCELLKSIAARRDDIELNAFVGNLDEGLRIVSEEDLSNYDVIISRGGTGNLIARSTAIPVVKTSISVFDILRAIKTAESYADKFAIVGFENITEYAHVLCELLNQRIRIVTLREETDAASVLSQLKSEGYSLVLGDMISSLHARQLGMNSILITSGAESLEAAVNEAVQLASKFRDIQASRRMLNAALRESPVNVFIFNRERELLYSSISPVGERRDLLRLVQKSVFPLSSPLPDHLVRRWNGQNVTITARESREGQGEPIYLVYTELRDAPAAADAGFISVTNPRDLAAVDIFESCGSANNIGALRETIEKIAPTMLPILILGEVGTGKDAAARLLYENGPFAQNSLYTISCADMPDKAFSALLSSTDSPLYAVHTTLYFKGIQALPAAQLEQLLQAIESSGAAVRSKLIFACSTEEFSKIYESEMYRTLVPRLSCLTLKTPPLRERADDIPSIAALYISLINAKFGRQVVGFEPGAMALLQRYHWRHNLNQFRRVLQELVLRADASYIREEEVAVCLRKEEPASTLITDDTAVINIHRPLEEINLDVLRLLMNEGRYNQAELAAQLGISRTTLWRMLKSLAPAEKGAGEKSGQ